MNKKEIKNLIDNLNVGYKQTINGSDYVLGEIDGDYFTFDSTTVKSKFKVLDSGELFDIIYEENL